ncbi:MAG: adenylate kinase [Actinobacteria bacterium]|nr:adenylate kinase [Actinomycetota bacterium]
MTETQRNVILLGAPGAGKGTQAVRIAAGYAVPHISTGEMLRAAVAAGTEMGKAAQKIMESGALVPDEVVIGVVRDRLAQADAQKGFLLDGFPRTIEQAERLDAMLADGGRLVTHVILIDVPEDELVERLAGRRMCTSCGKGYHVVFDPPQSDGVCDVCGAELHQRSDDNEATVRSRLEVYRAQTEPLVGYYEHRGVLKTADGGGRTPDEVFVCVEQLLEGD